jgi:hypothetical protein
MVKDNIFSSPLALLPNIKDQNIRIDAVACQLHFVNNDNLGILCVYRPPDSSVNDNAYLQEIITKFLSYNIKFNIVIGDFNFPEIVWPITAGSHQSQLFLNFTQENFLTQQVTSITRKSSNAILDLVFSTCGTKINNLSVNEDFGSSDHSIIQFSININADLPNNKRWLRNMKNADWNRFQEILQSYTEDWNLALDTRDIEAVWANFVTSVINALDIIAPYHAVSARRFRCSSKVRTALRHKRRSYHALSNLPSISNLITYERANSIYQKVINQDTNLRENYVIKTADQRVFWSYVNRRLSTQSKINSITHEGDPVSDPQKIASIFNAYFASIYQDSHHNAPTSACHGGNYAQIHSRTPVILSFENVLKVIKRLPLKTSVDSDGLSYKIIKKGGYILASRLLQLYNLSLEVSKIPSDWKVAIVSPIHKKDSKLSVKNYRPISVTSCCCRILERIINSELMSFLSQNNVLNNTQHGFRSGNSTETILLTFYDQITLFADNNLVTDCVFFDFQKAFDSVPHDLLLSRISSTGINRTILDWIEDFLSNRTQKVRVGQTTSDLAPVSSGVIQGSVLGPTLFNIFINNIDKNLEYCKILKYADDTRIFLTSPKNNYNLQDLRSRMQNDIDNFVIWMNNSGMSLNVDKSFFVSFGRSDTPRSYTINGNNIPNKHVFCDLGVLVQSSPIGFKPHIDSIVSKAFKRLGVINRVFKNTNSHTTVKLFKSFVRPLLEYSSIIWCPYTQTSTDNIERVQKRMCRMIPAIKSLSYRDQLNHLGLLSLRARRLRYQIIVIFKLLRGLLNMKLSDFFEIIQSSNTRGHNLRIRAKFSSHNYRLHFFTVSAIDLWNQLSQDDVDFQTVQAFKLRLVPFFSSLDIW